MRQHDRISPARRLITALNRHHLLIVLLGLATFILYWSTLVPGPFDGDYGEFQYMPRILGLPHPTGYPLYLLLGWLWSWLPLGTLAFRLNLFSALWAVVTVALLYQVGREQRFRWVAAVAGAAALALAPFFWRYAVLAAVYTLHTALIVAALWLWLRWSKRYRRGLATRSDLGLAAFVTGLSLTNHPTAAFLVPAAGLFLLLHLLPRLRPTIPHSLALRDLVVAALLFALPGLLYLYVPLRLWMIGPGAERFGLQESIAKGIIAPFLGEGDMLSVLRYITGRSLLGGYSVEGSLLFTDLYPLLAEQFGMPLTLVGMGGALLWAWRQPRAFVMLSALFLPSALYALTYAAEFASRNQIAHLEGHILPAMVVFALWIAAGMDLLFRALARLSRYWRVADIFVLITLGLTLGVARIGHSLPTEAEQRQSEAIQHYWSEVLAYPLEEGAALTGHWGDLTAFWYFQHGEGVRPDLWAIFPPNEPQIEQWLHESGRPVYLAGPLLEWGDTLIERYDLTPVGITVRVSQREDTPTFPPLQPRTELFNDQLALEGYRVMEPAPGRRQVWFAWQTVNPTPRDLSISLRLHAQEDETLLLQHDGRLASLWYPSGTVPAGKSFLTVLDLEMPPDLPPGTITRIVVYDPVTIQPLLTAANEEVFEVGVLE